MAVSGDIIEVTCNHRELGEFIFSPKSGEASTYNLGGFQSADDDGMVTANGQMIDQMTNKRWSFEVPVMWDMNTNLELENAQALQSHPVAGDWTFTHINGTVYAGTGKPVGTLSADANAGTFTLKVAGGNRLRQI
jgi:hypothetical protein